MKISKKKSSGPGRSRKSQKKSSLPGSSKRGKKKADPDAGPAMAVAAPTAVMPHDGTSNAPSTAVDIRELHGRWKSARQVIAQIIEKHGSTDPSIWEQGAYQLWLWLVIELMVVRRDEIDVGDLTAVSKMLHDQRKLSLDQAKHLKKSGEQDQAGSNSQRLPEQFDQLVRQIYGANLQEDAHHVAPLETGHASTVGSG